MQIKTCTNGVFFVNTYLLIKGNDLVLVDPGTNINLEEINKYNLKAILITHAHVDHIDGLKYFKQIPVYISQLDKDKLFDSNLNLYRMLGSKIPYNKEDLNIKIIEDNMIINLLDEEFKVIFTPGHTNGSVCYLTKDCLFSGDTLFRQSIGRTDFPTGSMLDMQKSLAKLSKLSNHIKVYPGHDGITSMKDEKIYNLYLKKS